MDKESHPGYPRNPRRYVEHRVPPTEQQWADYRKAVEALEFLRTSPYFMEGGPEYGAEVNEPHDYIWREYTETWDEYRERYNKWLETGGEHFEAGMISNATGKPEPVFSEEAWKKITGMFDDM